MKTADLIRNPKQEEQTTGQFTVYSAEGIKIFDAVTMELPNKNNQVRISCIPEGEYTVRFTYSPRYKRKMYLVDGVEGRSGIRIHSANYWYDLMGCISLGQSYYDINQDGLPDVTASRKTVKAFEEVMNGEDFILKICTAYVLA